MNIDQIEKFLGKQTAHRGREVKISLKNRTAMYGMFVEGKDFNDLKSKNFWRIVSKPNIAAWNELKDVNLAKIFHGSAFLKLGANDVASV